jgi:O-antigen/teichoic acid export membrane protein
MDSAVNRSGTRRATRVFRDTSSYMAGQLGLLLLGFVTFPLFTRLMSRADYGTLSLINTSLSVLLTLFGLGLPNAVVRFFPEYARGSDERRVCFNTTQLVGSILSSCTGCALLLASSFLIHPGAKNASFVVGLRCVAFVLVSRAALNILLEIFRVGRHVGLYNALALAQRLANAGGAVAGFLFFRSLNGLLGGILCGETLLTVVAAAFAYRYGYISITTPDRDQLWESLRFASPIMLASLAATVMAFADRYLIQAYLGPEAVATYAVAYDLCGYIQVLILTAFRLAVLPELVSRYTEFGAEAASEFLSRTFRYVGWLVIGVGFGFAAIGSQVITVLASNKYSDAGALLPYLIPGVLLGGLDFVFATGLYLRKRNDLWFYITGLAAVLNISLNVLLIPVYGIKGAAYATLLGYLAQEIAVYSVSTRFVKLRLDAWSLLRAVCCAGVIFLAIKRVGFPLGGITGLAVTAAFGAIIYAALHFVLEKDSKQLLRAYR